MLPPINGSRSGGNRNPRVSLDDVSFYTREPDHESAESSLWKTTTTTVTIAAKPASKSFVCRRPKSSDSPPPEKNRTKYPKECSRLPRPETRNCQGRDGASTFRWYHVHSNLHITDEKSVTSLFSKTSVVVPTEATRFSIIDLRDVKLPDMVLRRRHESVTVYRFPIDDVEDDLFEVLPACFDLMTRCGEDGIVACCCAVGENQSVVVVLAYMVIVYRIPLSEAIKIVRKKWNLFSLDGAVLPARPFPSPRYMHLLVELESAFSPRKLFDESKVRYAFPYVCLFTLRIIGIFLLFFIPMGT
jgi:hypothetical protein